MPGDKPFPFELEYVMDERVPDRVREVIYRRLSQQRQPSQGMPEEFSAPLPSTAGMKYNIPREGHVRDTGEYRQYEERMSPSAAYEVRDNASFPVDEDAAMKDLMDYFEYMRQMKERGGG